MMSATVRQQSYITHHMGFSLGSVIINLNLLIEFHITTTMVKYIFPMYLNDNVPDIG